MDGPEQTSRQRIIELLADRFLTARELAECASIPERQVEDHLIHIVKTVSRDKNKQFKMESSVCMDCGFIFRDRKRFTCPSRCPQCRSEAISLPKFGIEILKKPL